MSQGQAPRSSRDVWIKGSYLSSFALNIFEDGITTHRLLNVLISFKPFSHRETKSKTLKCSPLPQNHHFPSLGGKGEKSPIGPCPTVADRMLALGICPCASQSSGFCLSVRVGTPRSTLCSVLLGVGGSCPVALPPPQGPDCLCLVCEHGPTRLSSRF